MSDAAGIGNAFTAALGLIVEFDSTLGEIIFLSLRVSLTTLWRLVGDDAFTGQNSIGDTG